MFDSEAALVQALAQLRAAGVGQLRTYTPKPIDTEPAHSPLPVWILLAGLAGAAGGFAMQVYATVRAYPLDIGGRPLFSWPAYVPIAFEIGVLCAVVVGTVGYFAINRMPRLYDQVDECDLMHEALRDGWIVLVTAPDDGHWRAAREVLTALRPGALREELG
jgi:hypothetical protein